MDLPFSLFPASWHWAALLVSAGVFCWLALAAPWARLKDSGQLNLLLGFSVALIVLWSMKAGVKPGLNLHLLGAMAATLALGRHLATVSLGLALAGITLNGAVGWQSWTLNFVLMAVVPVQIASILQRLVERWLPAHFFVFVFVVAFIGSGVTVLLQGGIASFAMMAAGAYPSVVLTGEYLPYFILLGFAEAWISGAVITLMVVYRPEWVAAFDDRRYLQNK
jgi:uncharacterized membrane protein